MRYFSGRRLNSWSSDSVRSSRWSSDAASGSGMSVTWPSRTRRLGPHRPRLHGRLVRHAVEPVAEHLPWHDRSRLAGEDEEGRLEGVLGVVVVPEDPAADAPDHRAVAMDDRLEDGLLPPCHEAIQELPVRESPPIDPHARRGSGGHGPPHSSRRSSSTSPLPLVSLVLYPLITRSSPFSSALPGKMNRLQFFPMNRTLRPLTTPLRAFRPWAESFRRSIRTTGQASPSSAASRSAVERVSIQRTGRSCSLVQAARPISPPLVQDDSHAHQGKTPQAFVLSAEPIEPQFSHSSGESHADRPGVTCPFVGQRGELDQHRLQAAGHSLAPGHRRRRR